MRRAATTVCLLAVALPAAGCGSSDSGASGSASATPAPKPSATVQMKNLKFAPRRVTIHTGQTVQWVDKDLVDHSVAAKGIDSPDFAQGESWSHTFAKAGVFRYHDRLHPGMKGIVVVKH